MSFVETIKEAGIVGAGGAGFPTYVKLNAKAEYFIINAAECEPLIETDKYLCRTFPERIIWKQSTVSLPPRQNIREKSLLCRRKLNVRTPEWRFAV